ncbi:hypothetical protein RB195_020897 [Necator americanus]
MRFSRGNPRVRPTFARVNSTAGKWEWCVAVVGEKKFTGVPSDEAFRPNEFQMQNVMKLVREVSRISTEYTTSGCSVAVKGSVAGTIAHGFESAPVLTGAFHPSEVDKLVPVAYLGG